MNTVSKGGERVARNGRHKPVRWFSLLMSVAVLTVSGAVVADVILVYTATTSVGNAANPFGWVQGANAPGAASLGIATITCTTSVGPLQTCPVAGAAPAYELATTLNGVPTVTIEVLDLAEFGNAAAITLATGQTITVSVLANGVAPAGGITATNVVCAFAVVSDFAPSAAALTSWASGIAGCTIVVPTVPTTPDAGCLGTGGTAGNTIINLISGGSVTQPATGWTCSVPTLTGSASELYVSYMLVTSATASGNLYGLGVQVAST